MDFWKITFLGFLLWAFLLLEKYLFFEVWGFSAAWQSWLYYILMILFVRVLARRFGVINFLEAIFIDLVWLLIILMLDSFIAKRFLGQEVFRTGNYWGSYLAVFVAMFFLHKKRHIQVRKLLKHSHYGGGH